MRFIHKKIWLPSFLSRKQLHYFPPPSLKIHSLHLFIPAPGWNLEPWGTPKTPGAFLLFLINSDFLMFAESLWWTLCNHVTQYSDSDSWSSVLSLRSSLLLLSWLLWNDSYYLFGKGEKYQCGCPNCFWTCLFLMEPIDVTAQPSRKWLGAELVSLQVVLQAVCPTVADKLTDQQMWCLRMAINISKRHIFNPLLTADLQLKQDFSTHPWPSCCAVGWSCCPLPHTAGGQSRG